MCASQGTKTQKSMCNVSNNEKMLKCKTNRWRLVHLIWKIFVYKDNNANVHGYQTRADMMRTLRCNHYTTIR